MAPFDDLAEQAIALAFDEPRRAQRPAVADHVLTTKLDQSAIVERAMAEARDLIVASQRSRSGRAAWRHRPPCAGRSTHKTAPATANDGRSADAREAAKDLKEGLLDRAAHGAHDRALAGDRPVRRRRPRHDAHLALVRRCVTSRVRRRPYVQPRRPCRGDRLGHRRLGTLQPRVELIVVVDDHSTDDSLAIAEHLLARCPWLSSLLVGRLL